MNHLRHRRALHLGLVACLGLGAGLLAVRSDDRGDAAPAAERARGYARLLPSLCGMRDAVQEGEAERARALFWNNAHAVLHVLSAELADRGDRPASAGLHRAKTRLELTVAGPTESLIERPDAAVRQIDELVSAATTALRLVGALTETEQATSPCADAGSSSA